MIYQELRNKCDGIQLFIHFRKTQEFILKIMLKVSNFFPRFQGKEIWNFARQLNPTQKLLSTVVKCG